MSATFGLGVQLTQGQKLTPQMQQAIKLLQLSSLELEQEIQAKLDSNPLLERVEESFDEPVTTSLDEWAGGSYQQKSTNTEGFDEPSDADGLEQLTKGTLDDDAMDMAWQEVYGDDVGDFGGGQDSQPQDPFGATSLCIQDHIRWQMNLKRLSDIDKLIAEQLIDAMDEMGFIRTELSAVVNHFATLLNFYEIDATIEIDEVQAVLKMIQACHPVGVGARDLSECLMLQLGELPTTTPYLAEAKLVLGFSHYLQNNQIKELVSATKLSSDELKSALALIRTLNPSPAQSFVDSQSSADEPDIPDILVLAKDKGKKATLHSTQTDSWQVLLNPAILPKLQVNQEYASLVKRGDDSSANQYIKHHLQDAKLFLRSIEERNQNLLKVASCIVQKQQQFLLDGAMAMQPLTLKEVADTLGLHESTVSRLTTNKTMLTPQGLFPLKYFFSSHVQSEAGEVSSTAISAMIEEMVAAENPKKPLSDSELTRRLENKGVMIARRTVSKYREALGILSSTQRKNKL